MLAGYESQGCSAGGSLYSWIPVQLDPRTDPSLFSILLHISLSPLASSPRVLAMCPQPQMHLCGVCSTPATGQKEEHVVPRASSTLCWGPSTKEEKEGGGNGMNQLRTDPNTNSKILYFIEIIKKEGGEGLQVVTWTHHRGRINYTCDSPEISLLSLALKTFDAKPLRPRATCSSH